MTRLLTFLLASLCSVVMVTATVNPHIVEMKVVVDEIAISEWQRSTGLSDMNVFKEELNSMFVEVGELYTSLAERRMIVKFVIKDLILDVQNVIYNQNVIIGTEGLTEFKDWLAKEKKYEKTDYDLALLLTGYDVVGRTKSLLGFGMIATVCTDWAVGLLEYRGATYKDAFVIAHEIGHILGMQHDGHPDNVGSNCKAKDGYIMSPNTIPESINHFTFSYCSYEYFYNMVNKLSWECLNNGTGVDKAVKGKRLGTLISADDTCRRTFGLYSYVNRQRYYYYGDNVCSSLMCVADKGETVPVFSPQGLYCGKNKQCIKGKCIKTDEGRSDVSDDCPFGDQPKINYEGYHTCSELPLKYCGVMKTECCERCNMKVLSQPDVACSVIQKNPKAIMFRKVYALYNSDTICTYLACVSGYKNHEFQWKWERSPPGLICGDNKRCVGSKCLAATESIPPALDNCPFGDQPWSFKDDEPSCRTRIDKEGVNVVCNDRYYKQTCCASCYCSTAEDRFTREYCKT